jgi:uncharacterized membrane protein YphA (DoxX/SURF4 family)
VSPSARFVTTRPWIGLVARLVVAGTLLVAGALKAFDPSSSVRAVNAYQLLPLPMAELVGYVLPWAEIGLGLLLLVGVFTRWAAVGSLLLFAAFIIGIGSAWARGLSIDCGCFGGGGQVAPDQTEYLTEMLRDAGLVLLSAWLIRWPGTRLALEGAPRLTDGLEQAVDPDTLGLPVKETL